MNIHEYQAKALLREYGVAVPNGTAAFSPEEAEAAAEALGSSVVVVKSQIHAGGRGAGHFAEDPEGTGSVAVLSDMAAVRKKSPRMLGPVPGTALARAALRPGGGPPGATPCSGAGAAPQRRVRLPGAGPALRLRPLQIPALQRGGAPGHTRPR